MFDIGFGEMLLLAAIALIALGPKQLPEVARTLGRFMNQVKRATGEFQRTLAEVSETTNKHFDDAKNKLESHVIPPNYINSGIATGTPATPSTHVYEGQPTHEEQPSLPMNAVATEPAKEEAGDEHQQMSFDIDKKES